MEERIVTLEETPLRKHITVKSIFAVHSFWYSERFNFPGEAHEPYELVYILQGSAIVSTKSYSSTIGPGEFLIHRPMDFHRIKANNTQCRVWVFTFSLVNNSYAKLICDTVHKTSDEDRIYLASIYRKGAAIIAGKNGSSLSEVPASPLDSQIVKDSLELLLLNVIKRKKDALAIPNVTGDTAIRSSIVRATIAFLEENVCHKLKLTDVSKNVGYSIPHISRIFEKEIGTSVMDYFIKMKIQKASELLASKNMTTKDIAEYLEYDSVQYFSIQFKRITGQTPTQFKRMINLDNAYLNVGFEKTGEFKLLDD